MGLSPHTTSAGPPSSGSRRAKPPSIGRASPVTASGPTMSASCSGSSQPRQSAAPAGLARHHPELVADESPAAALQADVSFGTLGTSCSNLRKA